MMHLPLLPRRQAGISLIEVLVAILVLSFGMLALGGMLAYAVQMPKLAGYRATAAHLASSHIERIRANRAGFIAGNYQAGLSFDNTSTPLALNECNYPFCTPQTLAVMDTAATNSAVRAALPAGGTLTLCSTVPCGANSFGDLWVIWQEPATNAPLAAAGSDHCPTQNAAFTALALSPSPRCLYVRFTP